MANNLYPLTYKPGIKRDGTLNQADYCTSGQWVRFQRGYIRKIGGMRGVFRSNISVDPASDIRILGIIGRAEGGYINIMQGNEVGQIAIYTIDLAFSTILSSNVLFSPASNNIIWQSEIVIQGNNQHIVYLGSVTKNNIDNIVDNSFLLSGSLGAGNMNLGLMQSRPNLIGAMGLLFASNYLFVYGANGSVQWSRANNPLDFSNAASRQITISNDKVIHAKSIRGGINNPAILFWTLSSVVRCINNPTVNTPPDTLAFQIDVLSTSSSILSSRCVVEYDGRFFWPGTNRFFQYTGIVSELPNTMSLNYFFNNIDMTFRQNVFGVKNTRYGEIWWFYPEKLGTPGRSPNIPPGQPSRALIYNVREDSWYDTIISRNCGTYSEALGIMLTQGKALTSDIPDRHYIFRHEYETFDQTPNSICEIYGNDNNQNIGYFPIASSFTTPYLSWTAFNPMKQLTGVNRWMHLITLEPDFTLMPTAAQGGTDMTVTVNTKQYAQDFPSSSPTYNIPVPLTNGQDSSLAKVDTSWQGRYINLTFTTTRNFEMGQIILQLGIGDGQ